MWVCFGCGGILSCFDWHKIVLLFPLHVILKVMHTAHRRSLLSAATSSSKQKTPRAQQCTPSLLIPCADGKLNAKHHRTTPKPEIHITVEKAEAALTRK